MKNTFLYPFFKEINWKERIIILSYLNGVDLSKFSIVSRGCFLACKREEKYRKGNKSRSNNKNNTSNLIQFLPRGRRRIPDCRPTLVSYPRSGNSLVRRLIESNSGYITGSDTRYNRTLSASLLEYGYQGEGIIDDSVIIVKSHYPERPGYVKYKTSNVILVVRNPFDAIESYFHMGFTNTHNKTLSSSSRQLLAYLYDDFVKFEAKVWTSFHKYWLEQQRKNDISLFVVRFEDLININRNNSSSSSSIATDLTKDMINFCKSAYTKYLPFPPLTQCNTSHISSSSASKSISDNNASSAITSSGPGYAARTGKIGGALEYMSRKNVTDIIEETGHLLQTFGYVIDGLNGNDTQEEKEEEHHTTLSLIPCSVLPSMDILTDTNTSNQHGIGSIENRKGIWINEEYDVRAVDDLHRYGRKITQLRKSLTKGDTEPLETS